MNNLSILLDLPYCPDKYLDFSSDFYGSLLYIAPNSVYPAQIAFFSTDSDAFLAFEHMMIYNLSFFLLSQNRTSSNNEIHNSLKTRQSRIDVIKNELNDDQCFIFESFLKDRDLIYLISLVIINEWSSYEIFLNTFVDLLENDPKYTDIFSLLKKRRT